MTSDQGNMVSQREGEWVLVPPSHVVVPREPTEAMKEAAFGPIRHGGRHGPITSDLIRQRAALSVYRMMIDAAPPAEPRADDGVVERHMLSEPAEQSSLLTKGEVEDGFGSARASRDAAVFPGRPDSPHSDEGGEA